MIEQVFAHIVHKILKMMAAQPDFFSISQQDRKALVEKLPASFQAYLNEVNEETFLRDLKETLELIRSRQQLRIDANGLAIALSNYFMIEVATLLDRIPLMFYSMRVDQKRKSLEEQGKLPDVFIEFLSTMNHQQIFEEIFDFLRKVIPEVPYIVVQSARDSKPEVKKEIRSFFSKEYGNVFPAFQVSKYLYGGMKVFINGSITDQSWLGKIERFTSTLNS